MWDNTFNDKITWDSCTNVVRRSEKEYINRRRSSVTKLRTPVVRIQPADNFHWPIVYSIDLFQTSETKVYPIRWFILMIFVLYSASNAMQWTEYTIIDQTVCRFYGVSRFYVNMTSIIYMITYIPLIFPASYLLDKLVSVDCFLLIRTIVVVFGSRTIKHLKIFYNLVTLLSKR